MSEPNRHQRALAREIAELVADDLFKGAQTREQVERLTQWTLAIQGRGVIEVRERQQKGGW